MTQKIHKVLIANRGEIAVRIIRTLKKHGIRSVTLFHTLDAGALHVREADEALSLGGGELSETYLNIPLIIHLALKSGADAIHPGYGFLAENPLFADACTKNKLIFIGPDVKSMHLMGNKISARAFAEQCGLPVTKGLAGNKHEILAKASSIGFPLLVKAAAGGGGKGMRIVQKQDELSDILDTASSEALNYFGDATVYVEKFIANPRHIEIQVLGDHHGNVVHLFERECSVQRRYQKIIEESPSPTLTPEVRKQMGEAAVNICKRIGYRNAGTIEFLVDEQLQYYFLEMNTRIQVEHPVTEWVTGIDLVEEQIHIAEGEPLRFCQDDLHQTGHAIECRIYAENPVQNFIPSPGLILNYIEPYGPQLRIDRSTDCTAEVHSRFDPMISKLIAYGKDRTEAILHMEKALQQYVIQGIHTNLSYLSYLISHPDFVQNRLHTKYCDEHLNEAVSGIQESKSKVSVDAVLAAMLMIGRYKPKEIDNNIWKSIGYWRHTMKFQVTIDDNVHPIFLVQKDNNTIRFQRKDEVSEVKWLSSTAESVDFEIDGIRHNACIALLNDGTTSIWLKGQEFFVSRNDELNQSIDYTQTQETDEGNLFSPMPGRILKVNVAEGDQVERGTVLLVVEAMKMENNIVSPGKAIVEKVNVKAGDMVDVKTQLVHLTEKHE